MDSPHNHPMAVDFIDDWNTPTCHHRFKTVKKKQHYKCRKCGITLQTVPQTDYSFEVGMTVNFGDYDDRRSDEEVKKAKIRQQLTPPQPPLELWSY